MTIFTVWRFDDPDGAEQAKIALRDAEKDGLVKVVDHAVVSWPEGADRPDTEGGHDTGGRAPSGAASWAC